MQIDRIELLATKKTFFKGEAGIDGTFGKRLQ